ncbi:hypothetical protein LAZ67_1001533 [Cordylochernes scorpioides]|uniref:CCHC-type domain-containing protein n=1 Tax=Cordylochernes scorpioides TaxID=51811 RepID=A0ABY6JX36_9ARAC|nr:hypothetical protein LAZ67_1001533 [Cordylochernes scorpioides]
MRRGRLVFVLRLEALSEPVCRQGTIKVWEHDETQSRGDLEEECVMIRPNQWGEELQRESNESPDDIAIIGESRVNLQKKINLLKEYLGVNEMTLNESKSKVMVFRNGGKPSREDRCYLSTWSHLCSAALAMNPAKKKKKNAQKPIVDIAALEKEDEEGQRRTKKPLITLAQMESENDGMRERYRETMSSGSPSATLTLYQDMIQFIVKRSEQIKALLAEVENFSGTLKAFEELDQVMEANQPKTVSHSTQTSLAPSCKETSSQTDPIKPATPAPAALPAMKPASTLLAPASTKRKQPEAPNPPAKRSNLKGPTKPAPSRVSKPAAAQVVLHGEKSAAHTVVISDPREILKAVRAAHTLPQGVWASLRTKGKLVLHSSNTDTIPEVTTSLASKLNGMKVRQQKEILPRICLFKVDEETSNSTIEETFLETAAVSKLPGEKVVRVAHRSAPRNGTCTAFIEVDIKTFRALGVRGRIVVDGVILNFEESIRARVCFRCCGFGHNSAQCTRAPKCFHCGEDGHEGRACPSIADQRTSKCANCCSKGLPDKHEARASSCPILKSRALKF